MSTQCSHWHGASRRSRDSGPVGVRVWLATGHTKVNKCFVLLALLAQEALIDQFDEIEKATKIKSAAEIEECASSYS